MQHQGGKRMIHNLSRRSFLGTGGALVCLPLLRAMQQQKPGALAGVSSLLDGSDMVRVPPGEFSMGSNDGNPDEVPTRRIRITKPFEIGKYEVTQAQWEGVVRDAHMSADV